MARIPELTRSNPLSQVAAAPPPPQLAGAGWGALSSLAKLGADFVKPKAKQQAEEEGLTAVYRDADGTLKVKEKSVLGGEMADIHNSAAYAKYLAQRQIDMSQTFTELAQKHQFDPAGFRDATDAYLKIAAEDEAVPAALRNEILLKGQSEANHRFNGLYQQETNRTYDDADRNTKALRDMMADDYVNLVLGGDAAGAEAKLKEIEEISGFRANAPYISETEAQTASYLRALRGSAKAASLTQTLNGLEGATEISGEMRDDLMEVLKDPDLSPDDRLKLYSATQGRLKGIDAAGIVAGLTDGSYEAKVRRVESGGNASAANPNSTATGHHQFIESTWLQMVSEAQREGGASWAEGLSKAEILEMRKDPAASREMFDRLTAQNEATLSKNGLPVNDATKYLAHFLGAGGAVTALSADPATLVSDLLPQAAAANGFLQGMTVTDMVRWAERKMTVKASDLAIQRTIIDQIPDTEVRGMAARALSDQIGIVSRMEAAAASEYEGRLGQPGDAMTIDEVMSDNRLSDSDQASLVKNLTALHKDEIEATNTIAALNDPTAYMNFGDSKVRSSVDKAYSAVIGDDPPSSPFGMQVAATIALNKGYLPRPAFNAVAAAVHGSDPQALMSSMEFMGGILRDQPGAIEMIDGRQAVKDALADYSFYSGFMSGPDAAARMIEDRLPENVAKRKNLADEAKSAAKNLKPDDLVSFLSGRGHAAALGTEGQQGEMMAEYSRLFTDAYVTTGDQGRAKERALGELARVYGPDLVTGSEVIMKFPPQNFYPVPTHGNRDWMRAQLVAGVSDYVYGEDRVSIPQDFPLIKSTVVKTKEVPPDRITLTSDERTRREVASGVAPSYVVGYTDDDGNYQVMPQRFYFDPSSAMSDSVLIGNGLQAGAKRKREATTDIKNWLFDSSDFVE